MDKKTYKDIPRIAELLDALSSTARLEIILSLGAGEACVCHLEAALGQRQAYISQHLIALRGAGLITTRREGRFIYYRLADPKLLDLIRLSGRIAGVSTGSPAFTKHAAMENCHCPNCTPVAADG